MNDEIEGKIEDYLTGNEAWAIIFRSNYDQMKYAINGYASRKDALAFLRRTQNATLVGEEIRELLRPSGESFARPATLQEATAAAKIYHRCLVQEARALGWIARKAWRPRNPKRRTQNYTYRLLNCALRDSRRNLNSLLAMSLIQG